MDNKNWQEQYNDLARLSLQSPVPPVIGVIDNCKESFSLIRHSGGIPLSITELPLPSETKVFLNQIHGLLLAEQIEESLLLVRCAMDMQIPILAVGEGKRVLQTIYSVLPGSHDNQNSIPFKSFRGVDAHSASAFSWLCDEAKLYKEARRIHQHVVSLDTHCDTPIFFEQGIHFDQRDPHILVDSHKMREGGLDACIMVAYLEQQARDEAGLTAATKKCEKLLNDIDKYIGSCPDVAIAYTPDDLYRLKLEHKIAVMKGIENGYAIGQDIRNVEHFRKKGVVYMTLCHNGDNDICDSASHTNNEHSGLSKMGYNVISEMNRVGMMIDLSHAGEKSFYDALEASKTPIVCSHSSMRALCDHPRNLTDDQLRALSNADGVVQVTMYPGFLRLDSQATIEDAVNHLKHAVDIAGIDHVGVGTDFDGDGGIPGLADASEIINFTKHLLRKHFSETDLRQIWGENFLRVMRQTQEMGCIKF